MESNVKKFVYLAFLCALLLSCQAATSLWLSPTPAPTPTATEPYILYPFPSATSDATATPDAPPEAAAQAFNSSAFPANINPLTGLEVQDLALLERRPLLVKVSNLPRNIRPQSGLSSADHVYEYYTEEGTTRFAAVFYGQDAKMVGPIRSARFFDDQLM